MLKELVTIIKKLVTEDAFHISSEKDFIKEYIDETIDCGFAIDEELMINCDRFVSIYPYLPNPIYSDFYNNIYNSFKFIYDVDTILDEIFCDGLTLNRGCKKTA